MKKLSKFREGLLALANQFPAEKRHLFEPFVCHGDPFESKIFFVGANGVLDDQSRPMLHFIDYWSDEKGYNFKSWHKDLAGLPKGLSKTRRNADKMIALLDHAGYSNKVLSTNVFSIGSARLANLDEVHKSVAPFQYLIQNLQPEVLFVFGTDAKQAFLRLWPNQIKIQKAQIDGVEPFQISLNGKTIPGIFTKHLCYQTGDQHLAGYVSELLRLLGQPLQKTENQSINHKPISKMENQKSAKGKDVKTKFAIEPAMQAALDLFQEKWVLDSSLRVPCNSPGKFFQVISTERKRISIPIRNEGGNVRQMSLAAVQEFFMGKKWFIKETAYDINSTYGDLNFCGGFAKYLKMLTEGKNGNQSIDKSRNIEKFTPENFGRCFSILTSEIRKQGTITLVDNNNHNRTFHIVNDRIQLVCDNVKPPKISMAATRNIFLFGQHTGEKNEKKYHINGWYKDHMNYWIAIAKHLRSICQKL